ncbi:MAG: Polymorphic membrane protein [Candidatus Jorgensenbacteria bacterium GW2011_GWA1_48_11]|uniref:Polymorphic membrane protein n=1 Tax=Candidatus Jorgensenbacteria bacterium GW2011_GWA1_48_11 TaxID=1618660 RepID=A0A0G1WMZ4_9BACT|nr:MAG: Polymorphic membrane protein [Candidatus Jorgensenbacteria bacterium GW2011_GWA1_48_11]KKW12204.1 MAG: Polymorphic membrane protein [Candidatus Jorgensenbacteria bacterium GW2011_GWB1_49_9]
MNLKFLLAVIGIGAIAFWTGQSSSLFQKTFFNQSHLVGEIPLSDSGEFNPYSASLAESGKAVSGSPEKTVFQDCSAAVGAPAPFRKLIINEVAWMGSLNDALAEWFELKNVSGGPLDVSGYGVSDRDGQIRIAIPAGTVLPVAGFYLLERKEEATSVKTDLIYAGNLKNTDESLRLYDAGCGLVDEVSANPDWPAGGNDTKRTMERANDLSWHASAVSGGTPKAENSYPTINQKTIDNEQSTRTAVSGTVVTAPSSVSSTITTNYSLPTTNLQILISEIMVGMDGNASYEFIELYNAGPNAVDLTGWRMTKKTSSGSESNLVAVSRFEGKKIQAGKYFLLVNQGGYNGSVVADLAWPASYTLAYTNNAVVLYDAGGGKVEEITWPEIPKNQSFVRVSWNNSQFAIQGQPSPQNSGAN